MNLNRLLLSGALKPTRTILRGEGLLISAFAVAGAVALAYLFALVLYNGWLTVNG